MSASVLEFPHCRTSLHRSEPPAERACAEVIRLPSAPAHLTQRDLYALAAMTDSAAGDWICEVERGCAAEPSTVIVSGKSKGHDRAVLMICRSERKLLVIDAQLADDWRLLGIFDRVEDLALAWATLVSTARAVIAFDPSSGGAIPDRANAFPRTPHCEAENDICEGLHVVGEHFSL